MKKVITPYKKEVAVISCDKHTKTECAGHIWITFGYGSKYDTTEIELDFCDECADQLLAYLKKEFGARLKLKDARIL